MNVLGSCRSSCGATRRCCLDGAHRLYFISQHPPERKARTIPSRSCTRCNITATIPPCIYVASVNLANTEFRFRLSLLFVNRSGFSTNPVIFVPLCIFELLSPVATNVCFIRVCSHDLFSSMQRTVEEDAFLMNKKFLHEITTVHS